VDQGSNQCSLSLIFLFLTIISSSQVQSHQLRLLHLFNIQTILLHSNLHYTWPHLASTNEVVVGRKSSHPLIHLMIQTDSGCEVNCTVKIIINFMFAIQYAYTPVSFPSTIRATANGLCSMIGYVCGIVASVISSQAGVSTNTLVYVSGALFLVTALLMFGFPIETATRSRL
jgi:hypothetical protein